MSTVWAQMTAVRVWGNKGVYAVAGGDSRREIWVQDT